MRSGEAKSTFLPIKDGRLCRMRRATLDDAERLLAWRNDDVTRRFSFTSRPVTPKEHEAWLGQVLHNPKRHLFIVEVEGRPAGNLRIDLNETQPGEAEVSIVTAPEFRGLGVATTALLLGLEFAGSLGLSRIIGRVKLENVASLNAFQRAGFVVEAERDGVAVMARLVSRGNTEGEEGGKA